MGRRQKERKARRNQLQQNRPKFAASGLVAKVDAPDSDKTVLKTVPAKVDGVTVGEAILYDDGSVDIMVSDDAPQWAVEKIKATEREFGYSMGTE